jgi:RNA polymerase sigma-70 factor (ECF subfamily)
VRPEAGEHALVAAARAGDRDALASLLASHRALLLGLCRRALGDPGLAEDACQEATVQALLGLDRLRDPDRFGAWLAGIGLNVCRAWLREPFRRDWSWDALRGGGLARDPVDGDPSPDEIAEAAELTRRVRRAVGRLPRGQRAAVLLFYLRGLSQAETAAVLGLEAGAVKARLHDARRTLRMWLGSDQAKDEVNVAMDAQPVAVRVADVRRYRSADGAMPRYLVLLEEADGPRQLILSIGRPDADALVEHLERIEMPRPQPYTLIAAVLRAAGATLREVRISRLVEGVFYAELVVEGQRGTSTIDARPSDALNLAVRLGAPIRVGADLLAPPAKPSTAGVVEGARTLAAEIEHTLDQHRPRTKPARRGP